jgi:hypothetical protein
MGEHELALAMAREVLSRMSVDVDMEEERRSSTA